MVYFYFVNLYGKHFNEITLFLQLSLIKILMWFKQAYKGYAKSLRQHAVSIVDPYTAFVK